MILNQGTLIPGMKVLVTTDNWFCGPDGLQYRAVYGTLIGVFTDQQVLGIKTNARSTNWYAQIGGCLIAGCQIHYACIAGDMPPARVPTWNTHDGKTIVDERPSDVLNADANPWPELLRKATVGVTSRGVPQA